MNDADERLLREMIEQSGEMWLGARTRIGQGAAPIVICRNPEYAWYLQRVENFIDDIACVDGWVVEERPLWMSDAAEFFAEFGSSWPCWLGAIIRGAPFRAFIKNGREEGWSISLDMKTDPIVTAVIDSISSNGSVREALRNV